MDKDDKLCNSCGLLPQHPITPKPPKCGCKKKRCKKDCCENEFAFRKVVIPAALGDDVTGKDKPENGAYTNSYVEYEANGAQYMYDSYGVYTKIEGGGGGGEGTLNFNELENRPKYAGEEMTGDTNIPDVATAVANEASLRAAADAALQGNINGLANRVTTAEGEITTIEGKIPEQASATNQLADKNFVNSSIATNTANFIGTFNSVAELEAYSGTLTNNDYAFVIGTDSQGNTVYDRYKYNANTEEWAFEYELNNSSFTAAQWAAINSGITSGDVTKLSDLANIKTIGNNLTLDANGELSATDTVYNDFTGTDGVNAGTAGLVPAPAVSDAGKYLKADGTWATINAGPTVVQTTGTSTTDVMSQVATSQLVYPSGHETSKDRISIGSGATAASSDNIAIGRNTATSGAFAGCIAIGGSSNASYAARATGVESIAIGRNARATGVHSVAIGANNSGTRGPQASHDDSIALGEDSRTSRALEVSLGGYAYGNRVTRYIANVTDPQLAQDAATKNYTDNLTISYAALNGTAAPTTATEGKYVGQLYYDTTNEQLYFLKEIDDTTTPATYTWEAVGGGGGGIQNALIIREWS